MAMLDLKFTVQNVQQLIKAYQLFPAIVQTNMRRALMASMEDITEHAKRNHKFTSRSHTLENAALNRVVSLMPPLGEVYLDPNVEYAFYQHEGTGLYGTRGAKYPIMPKNPGGMLRWVNPATGRFIYAKKVMHPGVKADPFLYNAGNARRAAVQAIFNRYADKAIQEAGL